MSRSPEEIKNWESVLREESFDLPDATWQRMENDMRGFLAAQRREQVKPEALSWGQRIVRWATLPAFRWTAGFATMGLVVALFWTRGMAVISETSFAWVPGQTIESTGKASWDWAAGRCHIDGNNTRLRLQQASATEIGIVLERGEATFKVDHRKTEEAFVVRVGDCQVHVVGTTFTVGIDSLKQWVSVEEGRIRYQSARGQLMVSKGQSSVCADVGAGAKRTVLVDTASVPADVDVPAVNPETSLASKPTADQPEIVVPSCVSGNTCVAELARFVRSHPAHVAASEIALRWARLAARTGDYRDALVAYGLAADKTGSASIARLEAFQIRVRLLGQTSEVVDSLDGWIASLSNGTAIWREALALRKELARRGGDLESVKRFDSQLQSSQSAEHEER